MIKILLCDDNELILKQIEKLVDTWAKKHKIDFLVDIKKSGDAVLKEEHYYDIALVDVEMPGISGLRLAEALKKRNSDILIIIITSFQNYLDDAFRIHVFRYLSKPIDINRFNANFKDIIEEYRKINKTIVVEQKDEIFYVKTKDILYIENLKYGSVIVTKDSEYKTSRKLKDWLVILNQPNCFVYSHNSYVVNLQNVIDFCKTSVTLRKNATETATTYMSQRKYQSFKKSFFNFAGGIT